MPRGSFVKRSTDPSVASSATAPLVLSGGVVSIQTINGRDMIRIDDTTDDFFLGQGGGNDKIGFDVATGGVYEWYTNAALARTDTLPAAGAVTETYVGTVTSITESQAQHASAAGNPRTLRGQRGFGGFIGGTLTLGGGAGGTSATNLAGATIADLGTTVADVSARFQFFANAAMILDIYQPAAGCVILRPPIGNNLWLDGGNVIKIMQAGATYGDVGATVTGAWAWSTSNDVWFNAALTAPRYGQRTRGSDGACADITLSSQLPFATASTEAFRKPGHVVVDMGVPSNGGLLYSKFTEAWGSAVGVDDVPGRISTTTNTANVTVQALTIPDGRVGVVRAVIKAKELATGDCAVFVREVGVKAIAGAVTLVGVDLAIFAGADAGAATWTVRLAAVGATLEAQVTGELVTTIQWCSTLDWDWFLPA